MQAKAVGIRDCQMVVVAMFIFVADIVSLGFISILKKHSSTTWYCFIYLAVYAWEWIPGKLREKQLEKAIECNDTGSFQTEYKLHALRLAFKCNRNGKIMRRRTRHTTKKSHYFMEYSPKYIRSARVIAIQTCNRKGGFITYNISRCGAIFHQCLCMDERVRIRTCI